MEIEQVRDNADHATVVVKGEVDLANAGELREALVAAAGDGDRVVADLSGLEFIDSTGLTALLGAHRDIEGRGGSLELRSAPPMLLRLLDIVGLDEVLTLTD